MSVSLPTDAEVVSIPEWMTDRIAPASADSNRADGRSSWNAGLACRSKRAGQLDLGGWNNSRCRWPCGVDGAATIPGRAIGRGRGRFRFHVGGASARRKSGGRGRRRDMPAAICLMLGRTRELIAMGMNVIVLYCPCPPPRKAQAKVRCITHTGIAASFALMRVKLRRPCDLRHRVAAPSSRRGSGLLCAYWSRPCPIPWPSIMP